MVKEDLACSEIGKPDNSVDTIDHLGMLRAYGRKRLVIQETFFPTWLAGKIAPAEGLR